MSALTKTLAAQRAAADPGVSAFVGANAGSGKTRVLTSRVARLLLSGASPAKILCITFTKAAAAEMANRLFELLSEWSLADDDALKTALFELEGERRRRTSDQLALARRLFARAIETPGGLKIQTIHAFCESVLKRFPLEAGIPPGFSVIDDSEAKGLAEAAIDRTVVSVGADAARALKRLTERFKPQILRSLLASQLTSRQALDSALASAGGWAGLLRETATALGSSLDVDEPAALAYAAGVCDRDFLIFARNALLTGKTNATKLADGPIAALLTETRDDIRLDQLSKLFQKSDGSPRMKFGDADTARHYPNLEALLAKKRETFLAALNAWRAAVIFADTRAFFTVLSDARAAFDDMKAARGGLDYDDLISGASRLFSDHQASAWVLYKLDDGLDHILLDEAQDTSPAQWRVIEGALREFFAGAGARAISRTFFAVGDQKQSIYSFQGADAGVFREKLIDLGARIAAASEFVAAPLTMSFRSTAPVLTFVDALYANEDARSGLGEEEPLRHGVRRSECEGLVEIWPLVPPMEALEHSPWDAPLDAEAEMTPRRALADHLASTAKQWIEKGERLQSRGRQIQPGDLLFLVQNRSPIFHQTIRALGQAGIPVAGADRLSLLEDAAIEDLLSYARTVLLLSDDLSLAEILKSPLFDLDDEDLFTLARDRRGSLWKSLRERARERAPWSRAADEIAEAQAVALKNGAYAFFSHVLETGAPSGRRRLYRRLGEESRETIDELLRQSLAFELTHPRSLAGFVTWLDGAAGEIKRETDASPEAARVMTVHGAKGLEAPIVFLIDAQRPPRTEIGPFVRLRAPASARRRAEGLFALVESRAADCHATAAARNIEKSLQFEEYRRLLYVAATRACDRLYICGVTDGRIKDPTARPTAEKTWHALALDAMARLSDDVHCIPHPLGWGEILRLRAEQRAPIAETSGPVRRETPRPPLWLTKRAAAERSQPRLAPSRLSDEPDPSAEPAAYSPLTPRDRLLRGNVLHRMLELLPNLPYEARAGAADRLLQRLAPIVPDAERQAWRAEVFSVLDHPDFAPVFSPTSRAEVPVSGRPAGARPDAYVSGTIDRLAVEDDRILVVDYKTNRPPPVHIEDAPPGYIFQLAAYRALLAGIFPRKPVVCGLLWTFDACLAVVPADLLDHAFRKRLA